MLPMSKHFLTGTILGLTVCIGVGAEKPPAAQQFRQEIAQRYTLSKPVQLVECEADGPSRVFVAGEWLELRDGEWRANAALNQKRADHFVFPSAAGAPIEAPLPWREIKQRLRAPRTNWLLTERKCLRLSEDGSSVPLSFPDGVTAHQLAISPRGDVHAATSGGLLQLTTSGWQPLQILDDRGRAWAVRDVLGVGFDSLGQLWFAIKAGVGCQTAKGWQFYEGKEGLPWNDFTGIATGPNGEVWFTTHLGVIRFENGEWHYRQGRGWLPNDDVVQAAVDSTGGAWFATAAGVGQIERKPMTLAAKAELYEQEIDRYLKRTPFGYISEVGLGAPGDRSKIIYSDSDNDGLWTAMYGAGECFAYGATKAPESKKRAQQAFEALRFLQKVTQGGEHSPPKGYVARTIRPMDWPDPNVGRLAGDKQAQKGDRLWKVYEPRWPRSADGKWYWKSDTSSDELDGHFFFYPAYYDLVADTDSERERVREVVRDLADHLMTHDYTLVDHDGKPTRWAVYGPRYLNDDTDWWLERGLNSLSILSYLTVAEHVTGDAKYGRAVQDLIERHGYAANVMSAKMQMGVGSGNQSDDEMMFMCFYNLVRYTKLDKWREKWRFAFYNYWRLEQPEMNPFFDFAYAAVSQGQKFSDAFGPIPVDPWAGWFDDSMTTLRGFPLDRANWARRNSHRLDLVPLRRQQMVDFTEDRQRRRAARVNGKVLPVEERFFNHWNTDPWHLDYGGNGGELGSGTVFLLPYYMGLYHGFIQTPGS